MADWRARGRFPAAFAPERRPGGVSERITKMEFSLGDEHTRTMY